MVKVLCSAVVYGERVGIVQVDTREARSDGGWVWVQTYSHGAVRWERLTVWEWHEAQDSAELVGA